MANIRVGRRSGFIQRSGRMVRETVWGFVNPDEITLAAASTASLRASFNAAALALRPFTIVRVRGVFGIRSDQAGATEDYSGSLGYSIVSDQATAIGVTAVPTPETDRGSDLFFVYESLAGQTTFADATGFTTQSGEWKQFDSKAMRKVEVGQDMVIVVETSAISSGAILHNSGRFLLKLH